MSSVPTGAIWIDADGSGQFTPAFEYASRLVEASGMDFDRLLSRLAAYDESVAAQAARLVHVKKLKSPTGLLEIAARTEVAAIRDGFRAYVEDWKESETAAAAEVTVTFVAVPESRVLEFQASACSVRN